MTAHDPMRTMTKEEYDHMLGFTPPPSIKATDLMLAGLQHMKDRATTYDKPEGERSMAAAVAAFNAVTDGVMNTEEKGWLFMVLLKAVRSQQGQFKQDNYEDGAAYFALCGEAAAQHRG